MISVFLSTISSLLRPKIIFIAIKCLFLSIFLMVLLNIGVGWLLANFEIVTLSGDWQKFGSYLDTALDILGGFGSLLLSWFLFPLIAPIIASFFTESTAKAVESKNYPNYSSPVENASFLNSLIYDVRFLILTIALNLLLLPLLVLFPLYIICYYVINGYLLGREFFTVASSRHIGVKNSNILRKQHRKRVFISGVIMTILATIPLLNLILPIIAVVWMVHLYHIIDKNSSIFDSQV